jgi:hypothetical protein
LVIQEPKVHKDLKGRQDQQVHKVLKDQWVRKELKELPQEPKELEVIQEPKVHKDLKEQQDQEDHKVLKDQ